ncbi:MAG TPA: helix-turn-helix transcriptional regulator [Candidatus Merdenecus merdavium]|nr:helix-turn-helix transcriptional regulator [Candidatus Merdenecus merdavium]
MGNKRIEKIRDFINMINGISETNFFYMTEECKNEEFIPDPICPDIIKCHLIGFFQREIIRDIECGEGTHFVIDFGIHLLVYHMPEYEGYIVMGPLRYKRPTSKEVEDYVTRYHLTKNYNYILNTWLKCITNEHANAHPIQFVFRHIYNMTEKSSTKELHRINMNIISKEKIKDITLDTSNLRSVDKKYEHEQELRSLVAQGKRREAGMLLEIKDKTRYFRHSMMNSMLRLLSYNILYKQALTEAGIPSVLIEHVYASYIRDFATNTDSLEKDESMWSARMLDDYCRLSREYTINEGSRQVRKVMNYVMLNYTKKITVNSIAEYLGLTPNYLSAIFKNEKGISLTRYIHQVRINRSLTLLANTDLPITEVAEKVGIEDYNYFSRVFKQRMNMSPTNYRKDYHTLAKKMYYEKQK